MWAHKPPRRAGGAPPHHLTPLAPPRGAGPRARHGLNFSEAAAYQSTHPHHPTSARAGDTGVWLPGTSALANHPRLRARSSGQPPSGLCASVRTPATPCSLARSFPSCACTRDGQPGTAARQPRASSALGRRGGPQGHCPAPALGRRRLAAFGGVTTATGGAHCRPLGQKVSRRVGVARVFSRSRLAVRGGGPGLFGWLAFPAGGSPCVSACSGA